MTPTFEELGRMAEVGIIGGSALQRIVAACKLRRLGCAVFAELVTRKRDRMFVRAMQEAWTVIDLDTVEGQEALCWLLISRA